MAKVKSITVYEAGLKDAEQSIAVQSMRKRELTITIRCMPGASHTNWLTKQVEDSEDVFAWLINGFRPGKGFSKVGYGKDGKYGKKRVPARPLFYMYSKLYADEMQEDIVRAFEVYSHWSVVDRCYQAGKYMIKHLQEHVRQDSMHLEANSGKYAQRKQGHFGSATPFFGTGDLLKDLEVVVE